MKVITLEIFDVESQLDYDAIGLWQIFEDHNEYPDGVGKCTWIDDDN